MTTIPTRWLTPDEAVRLASDLGCDLSTFERRMVAFDQLPAHEQTRLARRSRGHRLPTWCPIYRAPTSLRERVAPDLFANQAA